MIDETVPRYRNRDPGRLSSHASSRRHGCPAARPEVTIEATPESVPSTRLEEQLRQERETFDQLKAHDRHWFHLKLAMGWSAAVLLSSIALACIWMVVRHADLSDGAVAGPATGLLAAVVGAVASVWRVVFGRTQDALAPVTRVSDETSWEQP